MYKQKYKILETYQMKSLQWQQKVGCLKNLGMNLWSFTCKPLLTWQPGQYPVVIFANRHAKSVCISTNVQCKFSIDFEIRSMNQLLEKIYFEKY